LVNEGVIHSTDTVIEREGDYRGFFQKMKESNNFSALTKAHTKNFKESVESMKAGKTPVVIDNTNIKASEAKAYVKAALELGFADSNIKFVDVGTGGLTAETLAARNTHGVPLEKIQQMMVSYKTQGPLTLRRVLESKDLNSPKILYSAVVLNQESIDKLLKPINYDGVEPPDGWVLGNNGKYFCDHMTIEFGKGVEDKEELGKVVTLTVTHIGVSDMAMAFKVKGYPSKNAIPHITFAINPDGGKPQMSNDITQWYHIHPFTITGKVTNVTV